MATFSPNSSKASVVVFEAETQFSKLLERAHQGEEITIMHHGEPYARLIPVAADEDEKLARAAALAQIRAYAKAHPVEATPEEIREWIEVGRM